MTAFELMERMSAEEIDLWYKYDQFYHSTEEFLNAQLQHTIYCNVPRKKTLPKPEDFARPLRKLTKVKNVQELKARLNKQLGIS